MTALKQYQHLESGGLWRENPDAQRRDVIVSFGEATLVICDNAGRPLTHWSLAALSRLNASKTPALFTPDPEASETLEIDDDLMVDAIEKVRDTLERARPRPGRLRWMGLGMSTILVAVFVLFWLPDILIRQTLSVLPPIKRSEIGATLLGHVQSLTGARCRTPNGRAALANLQLRVLGEDAPGQVVVLPGGPIESYYLPGGIITLNRNIVEDHEDPAVPAGYILAAYARIQVEDPIEPILRQAGNRATLQLLTTGDLPPETLGNYAEALLSKRPVAVNDTILLNTFTSARVPSTPYAFALDFTGEQTLGLIEADPMTGTQSPVILPDSEWISLQGICET